MRAVADGVLKSRITAIDPRPRATLEGLPIELLRAPGPDAWRGRAPFAEPWRAGRLPVRRFKPQAPCGERTSPSLIFEQVLPDLPPGVFVHFHDIFLCRAGYPEHIAGRRYNEQDLVSALIAGGECTGVLQRVDRPRTGRNGLRMAYSARFFR